MASRGFDVPLSQIESTPGAAAAFMDGWLVAFLLFAALSGVALVLAVVTRPTGEPAAG
jgi:hypothetical protein